ncbi:MAG: response regulator [Proteobacteria bacterium]|nr:response regulator [Pseudomonadota bacterium]
MSGSETILAVDDDPAMLELVGEVLTPLGYNVLFAATGEEALQVAQTGTSKIDLLLTDVVLPGIKGQELAEKILNSNPRISVLFMSGYLCPSMAQGDSEKKVEAFVQKPFAPNALVRKMRKLLD